MISTRTPYVNDMIRSLTVKLSLLWCCVLAITLMSPSAYGFDSTPPVSTESYSTHSIMTNIAVRRLKSRYPILDTYRRDLVRGANLELHEIKLKNTSLERLRVQIGGSNEGLRYPDKLWGGIIYQYRKGDRKRAFLYLGILLHMIQDMGVPSHAWSIYHQAPHGTEVFNFDNFEAMTAINWKPDFGGFVRSNPNYTKPWEYYNLSRNWTRMDTRHWHGLNKSWNKSDRDNFAKTWTTASSKERRLASTRQAWTAKVTEWALHSALKVFKRVDASRVVSSAPQPRTLTSAPLPR